MVTLESAAAEGKIFGILGPNGTGKTTATECAIRLRRPDATRPTWPNGSATASP